MLHIGHLCDEASRTFFLFVSFCISYTMVMTGLPIKATSVVTSKLDKPEMQVPYIPTMWH